MKKQPVPVFILLLLIAAAPAGYIQSQHQLQPLEFLTGGVWVGEFDLPNGQTIRQERTYEWSLNNQLIIGKTFRIEGDVRRQTREVVFTWNADREVIEFWDFIDSGGYGKGIVKETGRDSLYMEAVIVGSRHVDWKADFINKGGKEFVSSVKIQQRGRWVDAGTFVFNKK